MISFFHLILHCHALESDNHGLEPKQTSALWQILYSGEEKVKKTSLFLVVLSVSLLMCLVVLYITENSMLNYLY